VVAFVESIGELVGLAGPSGGAMFVLDAAARSEAITAAAACDPLAFELLTVEDGCDSMMRWGEWRSPPGRASWKSLPGTG
jgi:hypothetical protein